MALDPSLHVDAKYKEQPQINSLPNSTRFHFDDDHPPIVSLVAILRNLPVNRTTVYLAGRRSTHVMRILQVSIDVTRANHV